MAFFPVWFLHFNDENKDYLFLWYNIVQIVFSLLKEQSHINGQYDFWKYLWFLFFLFLVIPFQKKKLFSCHGWLFVGQVFSKQFFCSQYIEFSSSLRISNKSNPLYIIYHHLLLQMCHDRQGRKRMNDQVSTFLLLW